MQFKIQCLQIVGFVRTMSQYPPNFSYVEVDKAAGLDSLYSTDGNLDYGSQEILGDLDSEMEESDLKNHGFDNWVLHCSASYVGLPRFSNKNLGAFPTLDCMFRSMES